MAEKVPDKAKVLDLGCGNGRLLKAFKQPIDYTGVDFSQTLLGEARRLHPGKKFIEADLLEEKLWQKLGQFDAVFCIAVLHHIESRAQQRRLLEQIHRHLRPGGFAYLTVWNLLQPRYLPDQLRSWRLKLRHPRWLYVSFMRRWDRFCFTFDPLYFRWLAREAGFKHINFVYKDKLGQPANVLNGVNLTAELSR